MEKTWIAKNLNHQSEHIVSPPMALKTDMLLNSSGAFNKSVSKELLPIGTLVDVIGGVYPGKRATILGHTAKMYHEKGKITMIKQSNVRPVSTSSSMKLEVEGTVPHRELIEQEMIKIYARVDMITELLEQMRLDKTDPSPSGSSKAKGVNSFS